MPKSDGTGPLGQGPMTGRGFGRCGGSVGGFGGCCGRGLGFRRFLSPKNELAALEKNEEILKNQLAVILEEKAALEKQQK